MVPGHRAANGSDSGVDRMFAAAYDELRQLAARVKLGDPGRTLSPTALVNEAWLKLAASPALVAASPLHFKRIAARAMRQVLVEAARRRTAHKRGGGMVAVTFDEEALGGPAGAEDVLALDDGPVGAGEARAAAGADGGEPVLRGAGGLGDLPRCSACPRPRCCATGVQPAPG